MPRSPFRVLYREFLLRIVDFDLLASRADLTKLIGQLATFLAAFSFLFAGGTLRYLHPHAVRPTGPGAFWTEQHFLVSTTMVVVGMFAVLCWDSTFPDMRDVMVLLPLPLPLRTLFAAKLAALATALLLTVAAVNVCSGLAWPFVFTPPDSGWLGWPRTMLAYWLTMMAAGVFLLASVLSVQGVIAQLLPRRRYLQLSSFLQMAAFGLFLGTYFLEPSWVTPKAVTDPAHQLVLALLPTYWFHGLFQLLSGTLDPTMEPLARRALAGLATALGIAGTAFLLSYFRMVRKIVEEPDITPGAHGVRGWTWWAGGGGLHTAVLQFSARTVLRSRQHRVILAFYWGVGLAIALAYAKSLLLYGRNLLSGGRSNPWYQVNEPLIVASIVMLCFAVVGMRSLFSLPLALRANWVFRITSLRRAPDYLVASRRTLLALAVLPVWGASAVLFVTIWPWRAAFGHLAVLALLGVTLADLCVHSFRKIPFTCSYLPGKANIHVTAGAYVLALTAITDVGAQVEMAALRQLKGFLILMAVMGAFAYWAHRRTVEGRRAVECLQFEEAPPVEIHSLELHRDGVLTT